MMEPTTRTCCWRWLGRRPFLMSLSTRHTLVVVIKQCRWELFLCEQLLCFMCYCTICPKSCNIVRQTLCALSKLFHCLGNYIIPFFSVLAVVYLFSLSAFPVFDLDCVVWVSSYLPLFTAKSLLKTFWNKVSLSSQITYSPWISSGMFSVPGWVIPSRKCWNHI